MKKKIDVLRELASNNDWEAAIKLAGGFPRLGDEARVITRAKEAVLRPEFQIQMGREPALLIAAGIDALKAKYRL
ncbi:hypothetical protein JOE25_000915 [Serratia sp. PL17]|uniref:hypothetical protein n=1 Tax=Serratia sp. PL17 TaxID=2806582 RepID=UPI001AE997D1|nr:hypothetical protein [Serratia sp. PL17]MBP1129372.1 hypothetical protein [Serratia sp. PL17]